MYVIGKPFVDISGTKYKDFLLKEELLYEFFMEILHESKDS